MRSLQEHPDYNKIQAAEKGLDSQFTENERIAAEKMHRLRKSAVQGDVTNQKLLVFTGLQGRNQAVKKNAADYLTVTKKRLEQTFHSLEFVRDGEFQSAIISYQAQLELLKLRLDAGVENRPDFMDVFECRGQWYVSPADATEPLETFDTKEKAEQFAQQRKRRVRLLALLA